MVVLTFLWVQSRPNQAWLGPGMMESTNLETQEITNCKIEAHFDASILIDTQARIDVYIWEL
jgi:hypothetical protein